MLARPAILGRSRFPRVPDNTGNLITAGLENDFSNAYWTKNLVDVASEAHPTLGTIWKVTDQVDGVASRHAVERVANIHTDDIFYRRVLVKAGTKPWVTLMNRSGTFGTPGFGFNAVSGDFYYNIKATNFLAKRKYLGQGWWEIEQLWPADDASGVSNRMAIGIGTGVSSATQTYQGDGTGTIYIAYARAVLP